MISRWHPSITIQLPFKLARFIRRSKELHMRWGRKDRVVTFQFLRSFVIFSSVFCPSAHRTLPWPAKEQHSSPRGVSPFITCVFCHKRHSMLCKIINSTSCPDKLRPEVTPEWAQVYCTIQFLYIYVCQFTWCLFHNTLYRAVISIYCWINHWIWMQWHTKRPREEYFYKKKMSFQKHHPLGVNPIFQKQ